MENNTEKAKAPEIEKTIAVMSKQREQEKEEKLVILIIEIIISSTLREYYEKSNKIPEVQPARAE